MVILSRPHDEFRKELLTKAKGHPVSKVLERDREYQAMSECMKVTLKRRKVLQDQENSIVLVKCLNHAKTSDPRTGKQVKMHKFPDPHRDRSRCLQWLAYLRSDHLNIDNIKNAKVCSCHFELKAYNWRRWWLAGCIAGFSMKRTGLPLPARSSATLLLQLYALVWRQ
ncbi:hypothetical protein CAPTEDRAFT_207111, partial [Capitella teleta]